jgi:hypothetical protein
MSVRDTPGSPLPSTLDDAIWRTIAYAGVFQFPLRLDELHRRLMDVAAGEAEIAARLQAPPLRARVATFEGFVLPAGREDWVALRRGRRAHTDGLLARHARVLRALAAFPFVRMVALSGGCAHGNASDDDVDVFLVTKASRAWTATLLIMVASKLLGLRRQLCVNYVVAEDALALPERDRFTAAELVGLRPLAGGDTYRRFVAANAWVADRHPNFVAAHEREAEAVAPRAGGRRLEALLDVLGAGLFERAVRSVLRAYLRGRVRGSGVDLSDGRLKLHAHDHLPVVTRAFAAESSLAEDAEPVGMAAHSGAHTA